MNNNKIHYECSKDAIYGKKTQMNKYSIKELTSDWQYHNESKGKKGERNFLGLNKMAVKLVQNMKNKDYEQFRIQNDMSKVQYKGKPQSMIRLGKMPHNDYVYGQDKRVKKDVKVILEGLYGNLYDFQMSQKNKLLQQQRDQLKKDYNHFLLHPQQTRNQQDKNNRSVSSNINSLFKLSKFTRVQSKTKSLYQTPIVTTLKTEPN